MGQVYTVQFDEVAVTALQDFFEIRPAADRRCKILALFLSQRTDVGDAAEEMLRIQVIRGNATSGSGGTTPSGIPVDARSAAEGFGADVNNTTEASTGTEVVLHSESFNIRSGLQLILTPEMQWTVDNAQGMIVVRLLTAPADSLTMSGTIYVEEI